MTPEQIKELIKNEIKENLKIYAETSGPRIRVELYYEGQCINSKTVEIKVHV